MKNSKTVNDQTPPGGLERKLSLFPVTNIVIANMIGAGIFTTSGLLMKDLRSPLLMLGLWVAGGIIALSGALCYGELGAAIPRAGGEYVFLSRLFHPLFGFLSGWVSFFVGFSAPIAASAIGFSEYLTQAFPGLQNLSGSGGSMEAVLLKKSYAIFLILVFTLIHLRGIVFGARVQNFLTLAKIGLIAGLITLGLSSGRGNMANLWEDGGFQFDFGGWKIIGLSLMWIMFAYSGWNASAYIGSEVKNPKKNMPLSLLLGTSAVMLLYFLLNLFYIYGIPADEMKGVISIGGLAIGNLFGKSLGNAVSLMIAVALFSSLSAFIILGPRVYYAMAKDGYFFKFVADVHPVFHVPSKSIILQGLISAVIVLSGTFEQILTYMGFSLGIFPLLAVIGVFKLRNRGESVYKMPGFPFVPLLYILTGLLILVLGFLRSPIPSSIAILTAATGVPAYFFFKKSKQVSSLTKKDFPSG